MRRIIIIAMLLIVSSVYGYANLTPSEVHTRLVRGDTLILLDVRESGEYRNGHIAEPNGQLPITPISMPWNSNVLAVQYLRLPKNVDIIVYCGSGGRSASASSFLQSKGYTRIFNMTSGFSSWTFESRKNGFGDHSGQWVSPITALAKTIACFANTDTSTIIFPPNAALGPDSLYVELHYVTAQAATPPNAPNMDIAGLFRLTLLDPYGLSAIQGDSLMMSKAVDITLFPKYSGDNKTPLTGPLMNAYVPGEGWCSIASEYNAFAFHRSESILRKWYFVGGFVTTGVDGHVYAERQEIRAYPNPFNSSIQIEAPGGASASIYDIGGRFVEKLVRPRWQPDATVAAGLYYILVQYRGTPIVRKVIYLK